MRRRHFLTATAALLSVALGATGTGTPVTAASGFGAPEFQAVWERDQRHSVVFWGSLANAGPAIQEENYDVPSGKRLVQYFLTGRMEQNMAGGPVTSGLLVKEMVTGAVLLGGGRMMPLGIPDAVLGELQYANPDLPVPTFAELARLPSRVKDGDQLIFTLDRNRNWVVGNLLMDRRNILEDFGFSGLTQDPSNTYQHYVFGPLQTYINYVLDSRLEESTGFPITPVFVFAYGSTIQFAQAFERRVLLYGVGGTVNAPRNASGGTAVDIVYNKDDVNGDQRGYSVLSTGAIYYKWRYSNA